MSVRASGSPPQSSLAERTIRSILWAGTSQYLVFALGLVKAILLARLVGVEYFGLLAGARTWVAYLGILRLDLRPAVLRSRDEPDVLDAQFLLETASALTGFLLFLLVTLAWPTAMSGPVRLLGLLLLGLSLFEAMTSTPLYVAERRLRQDLVGRLMIAAAIVGLAVPVALAMRGVMLGALIADTILPTAIVRVGLVLATRWRPGMRWRALTLRAQLRLGWTLWLAGAAGRIGFELDRWLVFNLPRPHPSPWRATGVEATALYTRAINIGRFPMDVVAGMLGSTALSIYTEAVKESRATLVTAHRRLTWALAWAVFASATLLFLAAEEVVSVLGPQWQPMVPLLRLLAPFVLGRPLFQNNAQLLLALGRERDFQRAALLQVIVFVALCPVTIHAFGAAGAAAALSLCSLVGLVLTQRDVARHLGLSTWRVYRWPACAAALATALVLLGWTALPGNPWLAVAVKGMACATVFGVILLRFERATARTMLDTARRGLFRG
jgi:O-antigen/teichoic acid export membrane protein